MQPALKTTSYLHVVYGDSSDCGSEDVLKRYTAYTIELFNPDSHGDPNNHFGYNDSGMNTQTMTQFSNLPFHIHVFDSFWLNCMVVSFQLVKLCPFVERGWSQNDDFTFKTPYQ